MTLFSSLYTGRLDRELGTDDSTVLFTTARRKAAINEAQYEFAELTECLQRTSTVAIVAGTAEYDLNANSTDFIRFTKEQPAYYYTDASGNQTVYSGDDLPRREVEWLNRYEPGWKLSTLASSVAQVPQVYYERTDGSQRLLGFWPTPGIESSGSAKVVYAYLANPVPLTSDTQEPFFVGSGYRTDLRPFHQALVHFAASQLEKLRKDDQASDRQLQKFLGYVQRFLGNNRVKNGTTLTSARRYFTFRRFASVAKDPRT